MNQKLISLLVVVAEVQELIHFASGVRVYSRTFVMVNNIVVVPFYVKLGAAHSLNLLTAATVAIEDKWLTGWQNYWSKVITITATAIIDGSVMTVAAIW